MRHLIGYARVSTTDQDLSLQLEALRHAGCRDAWICRDTTSGTRTARPGLEACLRTLVAGDTIVVWRLDRLGRLMTHLVTVIEELLGRQVGFRALCDGAIDTTTASGELIFHSRPQRHSTCPMCPAALVDAADFVIDTAASLLLQRSDRVARVLHTEIE